MEGGVRRAARWKNADAVPDASWPNHKLDRRAARFSERIALEASEMRIWNIDRRFYGYAYEVLLIGKSIYAVSAGQ
jgi:hypothetical protein